MDPDSDPGDPKKCGSYGSGFGSATLLCLIYLILRCVRHHGGLGLRHMGPAIRQLLEALVVLHGERHAADLALEARLVPDLLQALELLHRVDRLLAFGTCFVHLVYGTVSLSVEAS